MTQTLIHLIRHGETDWNLNNRYQGSSDIPLNDTGRDQAATLATTMQGESWDHIVSSPLSRAMETAKAIASAIGIDEGDIVPDKRAQERSYGDAEGMTLAEREQVWPEGEWPGLESWESVALRAMELLDELLAEHAGERILVVAHGGFINAILATLSNGEVGTGKSVILNTSRTVLTHDGTSWEIGAISDVAHLDDVVTA